MTPTWQDANISTSTFMTSTAAFAHLLSHTHHLLLQQKYTERWRDCRYSYSNSRLQNSTLNMLTWEPALYRCANGLEARSYHADGLLTVRVTPAHALWKIGCIASITGVTISWNWAVVCATAPRHCTVWTNEAFKAKLKRLPVGQSSAHLCCCTGL